MHSSGIDMWAFYSTHYETLTKQSDVRASEHASKPVRKLIISGNLQQVALQIDLDLLEVFKSQHACRDLKDGELCLYGTKPEETLMDAHNDTDVQIVCETSNFYDLWTC